MWKWIAAAIVFGPITTFIAYLWYRWYSQPEKIKTRKLKQIRSSQQQFCDW